MSLILYFSLLSAVIAPAAAQTWTNCNPLNQTDCPSNTALGMSNATFDFTKSSAQSNLWNITAGDIVYGPEGADAPTIQSKFYIFFGEVEVWLKAAPGHGVVSSTAPPASKGLTKQY